MHADAVLALAALLAIAGYVGRAFVRWNRPGTVSDDIRADAHRALNNPRRLTR